MTDEMLSKILSQEIATQFEKNQKAFVASIGSVISEESQVDPDLIAILTRSSLFTAQFTIQFMIRYLEATGMLKLPPDDSPILYPIPKE